MPTKRRDSSVRHRRRRAPKRKVSISVIGAGRLGTALALALASRGYTIDALVARSIQHARRAAKLINPHTLALSSAQLDQLPQSSLLFITTPDDVIAATAAQLAAALHPGRRKRTALHASGALSSDALNDLRSLNFSIGSMHPLISVSDSISGAQNLREAFYCIEGDRAAVTSARALVHDLGGQSFSVNTRDKALYHAAAVMASGHVVALFDIAMQMLTRCGLTEAHARNVLIPLTRSTLENLSTRTPARALTGTFARADIATVERHLAALRQSKLHDALAAYVLLGQHALQLAKKSGLNAIALQEIATALKSIE